MRAVFCGTPEFSVPGLDAMLDAGLDVPLVVSQPDRVRGRRQAPTPTPVRARALERGVESTVLERGRANRDELYERILDLEPDIVVVVAFGHIVREPLLHGAPLGCLNVHASLLPRWRGPAPIHTSILAGDEETGVCTMKLAAGVDTGDVYDVARTPIGIHDTAGTVHDRLAELGAQLLVTTLKRLEAGDTSSTPQPDQGATHAPMLDKREGSVAFDRTAREVHDRVRGLDPWPGVTVTSGDLRLKIRSTDPLQLPAGAAPGTVVSIDGDGMHVACLEGVLRIGAVQPAGRKAMKPIDCARGYGLTEGMVLTPTDDFSPVEPRT
mgnify:CR=1 FL=1